MGARISARLRTRHVAGEEALIPPAPGVAPVPPPEIEHWIDDFGRKARPHRLAEHAHRNVVVRDRRRDDRPGADQQPWPRERNGRRRQRKLPRLRLAREPTHERTEHVVSQSATGRRDTHCDAGWNNQVMRKSCCAPPRSASATWFRSPCSPPLTASSRCESSTCRRLGVRQHAFGHTINRSVTARVGAPSMIAIRLTPPASLPLLS